MGIKKQFLKSKPTCKVSFKIKGEEVKGAKTIQVLGDFNNWDQTAIFMKSLKTGGFSQTIELELNKDYQFRYLINGSNWSNDMDADAKINNPFNEINDIVSTFK